ncbi:MAG: exosortase A [Alteromonadaceae bacterium]|nr:exosortase A [Alteromonadaceae bacterium]
MKITDIRFITLLSILVSIWAYVFSDALLSMEGIWRRSDTFAHGYFIFPISVWLVWRGRQTLIANSTSFSWLALLSLSGALAVWLFSYAADINILGQLSAVVALISLLWLMIGNRLAWHYKFQLVFLLFAVPMGENLIPWLQDVTAWFTVTFLKLHGIPVFRDGLYIQVPSGMFEVAVACSGIRYLIASLAVGTLYAYLTYQKGYKQIAFIIFAGIIPILANGIRAYLIVIIAHYSDMEYATGADHLIYGWVFFGLVIMFMFWIGGKFADPEPEMDKAVIYPQPASINSIRYLLVLIPFFIVVLLSRSIPVIEPPSSVQTALKGQEVSHSDWGISFSDSLNQSHILSEEGLEIYKAVYANKQSKGELISSINYLHEHEKWTVINQETFEFNKGSVSMIQMRNIVGKTRSYIYQYRAGSYRSSSKNIIKLVQAWNSLSRQSDYSEIVAISIENNDSFEVSKRILKQALLTMNKIEQ